eukprot:TRINITY_DN19746_c0_g3_i1.p3 TRINITY_DN19746_c0_g3~~TRINITY_DN19746_c0_g3_i1.p3  ORF type:complete len:225 (+),score=34.26 TRINITY_DN19746_c0_g3_i1:156-830(+)
MIVNNFSHLFEQQASNYVKFRPTYPQQLYDIIFHYSKITQGQLAVDVATGNGQAANQLAPHFHEVVGIDSSQSQIQHASSPHKNVQFKYGDCHILPFENDSVDMITVAQGLHWFELDTFYKEAARVLKPNCALAAWCYSLVNFRDYPEGSQLLSQFANKSLKDFWDDRAMLVTKKYEGMEPDSNLFVDFQKRELKIEKSSSLRQLKGYLEAWSIFEIIPKEVNC